MSVNFGKNFLSNPRKSQPILEKPFMAQVGKVKSTRTSKPTSPRNKIPFLNDINNSANEQSFRFYKKTKSLSKTRPLDEHHQNEKISVNFNDDGKNGDLHNRADTPVTQNPKENEGKFQFEGGLKNLSEYLSLRAFKAADSEFQNVFIEVFQKAQRMETKMGNLIAEIKRLDKLNNYLFLTQKYKEELLCKVLEENRKLRENLGQVEIQLANKNYQSSDPYFSGGPAIYDEPVSYQSHRNMVKAKKINSLGVTNEIKQIENEIDKLKDNAIIKLFTRNSLIDSIRSKKL